MTALNDRGVAQMGQFRYADAHSTFSELTRLAPFWDEAHVNLAIATLNRQEQGDERLTLSILNDVLRRNPSQVQALYTSGIVHLYLGEPAIAAGFLERALEVDPADAYTAYFLGQAHLQNENYAEAKRLLLIAIELNDSLQSAYWAAATASRRMGDRAEADRLIVEYQRIEANPLSVTAGISYKQMGPKAEAFSTDVDTVVLASRPEGELFDVFTVFDEVTNNVDALTSADINADGKWDLLGSTASSAFAYLGNGSLFERTDEYGFVNEPHMASMWGDLQNDGFLDLVLCKKDGVEVWQSNGNGDWSPTSIELPFVCSDGALVDADHDGDVDVFLIGKDGFRLLNNNLDGTFTSITDKFPIVSEVPIQQVIFEDFDADRDLDLLMVMSEPPHRLWKNDRTWNYVAFPGAVDLVNADISLATAADFDTNGFPDLITADSSGTLWKWQWDVATGWSADKLQTEFQSSVVGELLAISNFDIDGDGQADIMLSGERGVVAITSAKGKADSVAVAELSVVAPTYMSSFEGPALVVAGGDGIGVVGAGKARQRFLYLQPTGKTSADQMRSNASGIGTRVQVKIQSVMSNMLALDPSSAPGQSLIPVMTGLGGYETASYVELMWPDGVSQSEIELAAGELHRIEETQRQLASCPIVFAWNGEKYEFVTDVLGVAALGLFYKPGETVPVRPFERYLFPDNFLRPLEGKYHIKIGEPMEEVLYLDTASLHTYDIPAKWHLVLDERMSVNGNDATGRPIFYRRTIEPTTAVDGSGADVISIVKEHDRSAVPPGSLDKRFVGLLVNPFELTLGFTEALDDHDDPVLVADAWMEYPYSQTVFAASQAGMNYKPVSVQAKGKDGKWQDVAIEFGYPAGMPKKMALPLTDLPEGTRALRLTTNMEIYWDRIYVVLEEQLDDFQHTMLTPVRAFAKRSGFAKRSTGRQRLPYYDYSIRAPYWGAKYALGLYTNFGDVLELTESLDGAMAIVGSGEEIHLEFDAKQLPVHGTRTRKFVLDVRGWAKDMDLYTSTGETVEPIPQLDGLSAEQRKFNSRRHSRYNLRFQHGLDSIPSS